MLIGRNAERRTLDGAIEAARSGLSAALVVHGEAGVGKTALLLEAARSASDFEVTHVTAPETEIELPYGGLNRLLSPYVATVDRLPLPARETLHGAFGLTGRSPGDRHLVGLAALALLSAVARRRPLLCVVDDAQWLDHESRDALVLVARRLGADRIALMFGVRETADTSDWYRSLPRLPVNGLDVEDAIQLAGSVARLPLSPAEARRIAEATRGSPMAIVELTTEFESDQYGPRLESEPMQIARRLEGHFLARVRALPVDTQTLLLIAALDVSGDPAIVTRAAGMLTSTTDAASSVSSAGLLDLANEVRFRHPLIRSAIQRSSAPQDRQRAHRALAEATDVRLQPEQRAWHRSAGTATPDDEIASDLVELAERTRERGAHAVAGALLAKSAELTTDAADRVERILAATSALADGGALGRARELLVRSSPLFRQPYDLARAMRLHGVVRYDAGEARGTASMLLEAARALYPIDIAEARATVLQAFAAARITGRFALPGEGVVAVCAAERSMPLPPDHEPTPVDLLLEGDSTLYLEGHQAAVPTLARALERLQAEPFPGAEGVLWLAMGCWAAGAIGDDVTLHVLSRRLVDEARQQGALMGLAHGLLYAGMSELFSGSLVAARVHFVERSHLLAAVGQQVDVCEMITRAWLGDESQARLEAKAVASYATEHSHGWMLIFVEYAMCVLDLGLGNYRAAFNAGPKKYDDSPFVCLMAFPDLIEAALRCGERSSAERALEELSMRALTNRTPLALGLLARCRAMLANDTEAGDLFSEALDQLERSRATIQLARTRLLHGEWLRRRKLRTEARSELAAALDVFEQLGAAAFAERARRELAATGEQASRRHRATDDLTPQEREIAALAATGATNADIAQKLFLSSATVDYHLRKVYRKLAISSRKALSTSLRR